MRHAFHARPAPASRVLPGMSSHLVRIALAVALLAPATAVAEAPSEADLKACVGGKASWTPTVLSKLKAKMTPEQVAKVLPGADQVSKYGFVKVPAAGCAGATEFELYFAKDKKTQQPTQLQSVRILFDSALSTDEAFYDRLVKVLTVKYGRIRKKEQVEKKLITWVNRRFKIAQLSLMSSIRGGKHYQLNVSL